MVLRGTGDSIAGRITQSIDVDLSCFEQFRMIDRMEEFELFLWNFDTAAQRATSMERVKEAYRREIVRVGGLLAGGEIELQGATDTRGNWLFTAKKASKKKTG